jgi:DNA adenine methylase
MAMPARPRPARPKAARAEGSYPHAVSDRVRITEPVPVPLLRWAGSKRTIVPSLLGRVPHSFTRYIEPFAGSACLFFSVAPRRAILGDLNSHLISFYRTLRSQPRPLARALHGLGVDKASYYEIRSMDPCDLRAVDRAARFLYLNRMSFNGVYRTNRQGRFNVPMGRRVGALPSENMIVAAASRLRRASLVTGDFQDALEHVRAGDFVYLDPPYSRSPAGNYGVYGYGSFDRRDLARLVEVVLEIDRRGATFLLSYADVPELTHRLANFTIDRVAVTAQVGGTTARRSTRQEVLVSNQR